MDSPKVLISDPISERGVDELSRDRALEVTVKTGLSERELVALIPSFSALVVRSQTKVTAAILNAGAKLRVVGRAGVGVDNVDVETATRRGIVVLNAPGGNTLSTAEHAFSLLLCLARKISQADANVRTKSWDKKNFEGVEVYNKTLGVIGMGRIGSELSRRAIAFGMRVVAYDPYLSATRARSLQVELVDELDDLLTHADFISLHTPLTAATRHILDAARLSKTKHGVRIINCARGGLIDEAALAQALRDGQVAGAALDVFEVEPLPADSPLRDAPNVVLTPHLGASTAEAQESVGIEIAHSIRAVLLESTSCCHRPQFERGRQPGRNCQRAACAAVHRYTLQVFALDEALDQTLQVLVGPAVEQRLHAFLKTFAENRRPARKVVAQEAFFRAHLVGGKKQRHYGHAHNQGQDDFQSRTHQTPQRAYVKTSLFIKMGRLREQKRAVRAGSRRLQTVQNYR